MSTELYETIAQGARYWFLLLMVIIALRSYLWLRKDARERKKRLKLLPDAGFVGELVVLSGNDHLQEGDELPLPCEGFIGGVRSCDVCLPAAGVSKRHAWFCYEKNKGVLIEPLFRQTINVDGATLSNRRQKLYLRHGSRLTVGDCVLRLRLFAGFEGAGSTARQRFADDAAPDTPAPVSAEQIILAQRELLLRQQELLRQKTQAAPYEEDAPEEWDYSGALPPISEDDGGLPPDETEDWPTLPYPGSADGQPDKSLYVETPDNEEADRLVWNRLLKRRRRE